METWKMILQLPAPALAVLALFALGILTVHGCNFYRLVRVRDDIRAALGREGYDVNELALRWLTRGPFPDLPLYRRAEYLYHVQARDRSGRPRTGWVRWRVGWPWQPSAPWRVHWQDVPSAGRKGLSTAQFLAMLVPLTAIVLLIVSRIWQII